MVGRISGKDRFCLELKTVGVMAGDSGDDDGRDESR